MAFQGRKTKRWREPGIPSKISRSLPWQLPDPTRSEMTSMKKRISLYGVVKIFSSSPSPSPSSSSSSSSLSPSPSPSQFTSINVSSAPFLQNKIKRRGALDSTIEEEEQSETNQGETTTENLEKVEEMKEETEEARDEKKRSRKSFFGTRSSQNPEMKTPETDGGNILSSEAIAQVAQMMKEKKSGVSVRDRTYLMKKYRSCFIGKEAVDWMLQNKSEIPTKRPIATRKDAILLGTQMVREGLFYHVLHQHNFQDDYLFFRFTEQKTTVSKVSLFQSSSAVMDMLVEGYSAIDLCRKMSGKDGVPIKNRRYLLKVYPNCFVGSKGVDWLVENLSSLEGDRIRAVEIGRLLGEKGYIRHVVGNHHFQDDHLFYEFTVALHRELGESNIDKHQNARSLFDRKRTKKFRTLSMSSEPSVSPPPSPHGSSSNMSENSEWTVSEESPSEETAPSPTTALKSYSERELQVAEEKIKRMWEGGGSGKGPPISEVGRMLRYGDESIHISGIKLTDRRFLFSIYKNCFVAKEAVDWLVFYHPKVRLREDAVKLGRSLVDAGIIKHVTGDQQFRDGVYFFRFNEQADGEANANSLLESSFLMNVVEALKVFVEKHTETTSTTETDYSHFTQPSASQQITKPKTAWNKVQAGSAPKSFGVASVVTWLLQEVSQCRFRYEGLTILEALLDLGFLQLADGTPKLDDTDSCFLTFLESQMGGWLGGDSGRVDVFSVEVLGGIVDRFPECHIGPAAGTSSLYYLCNGDLSLAGLVVPLLGARVEKFMLPYVKAAIKTLSLPFDSSPFLTNLSDIFQISDEIGEIEEEEWKLDQNRADKLQEREEMANGSFEKGGIFVDVDSLSSSSLLNCLGGLCGIHEKVINAISQSVEGRKLPSVDAILDVQGAHELLSAGVECAKYSCSGHRRPAKLWIEPARSGSIRLCCQTLSKKPKLKKTRSYVLAKPGPKPGRSSSIRSTLTRSTFSSLKGSKDEHSFKLNEEGLAQIEEPKREQRREDEDSQGSSCCTLEKYDLQNLSEVLIGCKSVNFFMAFLRSNESRISDARWNEGPPSPNLGYSFGDDTDETHDDFSETNHDDSESFVSEKKPEVQRPFFSRCVTLIFGNSGACDTLDLEFNSQEEQEAVICKILYLASACPVLSPRHNIALWSYYYAPGSKGSLSMQEIARVFSKLGVKVLIEDLMKLVEVDDSSCLVSRYRLHDLIRRLSLPSQLSDVCQNLSQSKMNHQELSSALGRWFGLKSEKFTDLIQAMFSEMLSQTPNPSGPEARVPIHRFWDWFLNQQTNQADHMMDRRLPIEKLKRPLPSFYIASSHNTYLEGNQLNSISSCRQYASVLRTGCRCIEIDVWDGDDGRPIVWHGNTLTTKVLLERVIKTVRDFAFCASDLPLVISVENHCSIPQQVVMARLFLYYLGSSLAIHPQWRAATQYLLHTLPSPLALRRKVLIKGKCNHGKTAMEFGRILFLRSAPISSQMKLISSAATTHTLTRGVISTVLSDPTLISSQSESGLPKQGYYLPLYATHCLLRVYPKGGRINSSNYNPMLVWQRGGQMAALNYQTSTRKMAMERALFLGFGRGGYVLQPIQFRNGNIEDFMSFFDTPSSEKSFLRGRFSTRSSGGHDEWTKSEINMLKMKTSVTVRVVWCYFPSPITTGGGSSLSSSPSFERQISSSFDKNLSHSGGPGGVGNVPDLGESYQIEVVSHGVSCDSKTQSLSSNRVEKGEKKEGVGGSSGFDLRGGTSIEFKGTPLVFHFRCPTLGILEFRLIPGKNCGKETGTKHKEKTNALSGFVSLNTAQIGLHWLHLSSSSLRALPATILLHLDLEES